MPETERKLVLLSSASSEFVEYRWPLSRTETWDEAVEIVETIRWVCRDFPDLKLAVEKFILNSFEPTSYESMKQLCERYNRAVANIKKLWSGRQPPPGIDAPPSIPLLRHIINQAYNRAVTNPEELNSYEPFSPEVYGETSFELVCEVMKLTKMTENDVFVDLGSGIGQVVLQVAAKVGCKCYGMEKAEIPAKFAECMEEEFVRWMDWYGKSYGEFELMKGDFLDLEFERILQSATVVFTNNFAFGPKLNHELKLKFSNLKDGTKIVSSHEFCPLNFRITPRNTSDIGCIMHVAELSPLKGSVSWTGKQVSYYLHTIDRGKLETFYLRQKHPDEYRSESSSRSGSSSSEDSCSGSSSESEEDEDHFKNALQRIKLAHARPGSKKGLRTHQEGQPLLAAADPNTHSKHRRSHRLGQHTKEERRRKRRWRKPPRLKGQKDSNSSPFSSSAVSSPGIVDTDGLFSSFHHQLEAYMGQLNTPYYQQWIVDAIEKEKMKKNHLQAVITHLESEVAGLSKETVEQMKVNMKELGIKKMTPDGLLLGATSIVSQNKQLRKELNDLEREIALLRHQNRTMEAMCGHPKGDPKHNLPKLPLMALDPALTNGIASPRHVTSSSEGQSSELVLTIISAEDLIMHTIVEDGVLLSTINPKHMCLDLVKRHEIELERIDQQLLELGPYAQDAYDDEPPQPASAPVVVSPPPPPVDNRRGRKGKQAAVTAAAAQKAANRRGSRVEEVSGGWRAGWTEVHPQRGDERDQPKKKWRKVGSAGPTVRGKEGQLDAQSDPLNVSSANLILTPTSELDRRGGFQSTGEQRRSSAESLTHPPAAQTPQRVGGAATPTFPGGGPPSGGVSTSAHSTPSCSTASPRSQPTAHWKPVPVTTGPAHQEPGDADTSEEIDVTRIEGETTPSAAHPATTALSSNNTRRGPKTGLASDVQLDHHPTHPPPSPQHTLTLHQYQETTNPHIMPHTHHSLPAAGSAIRHPGFSISNLARGSETPPQSHDTHMTSHVDYQSVPSPHGDAEGVARKRRTSSSSSHRSTRHSLDDNMAVRSGSPLSSSHPLSQQFMPGVIWDSSALSPGNKEHLMNPAEQGKPHSLPPFAMWPPGVPVPTDPAQLQRFSLSSPFLAASNPWLRGGFIPGFPFRPALYPTGATAAGSTLDPANPYKSMLGLSLYPFSQGLKGHYPTPAFTAPANSAPNSQPQTPSANSVPNPGFSFGQYPIPQSLNPGSAILRDAQARFSPGQPQGSYADMKHRGSPENTQEAAQTWPPVMSGVPMLQAPIGFGVNALSTSGINLLAAQRGSAPFFTSPLTLVTQSALGGGAVGDVAPLPAEVLYAQGGSRRGKKQIDLTGREPIVRHFEAPSPQEAVKMATQRMSPFQDHTHYSPKPKGVSEMTSVPPSSPLVPNFAMNPNIISSQAQGQVFSYPATLNQPPGGAHLVNSAQLMGVAVPGNHMISMNYPPPGIPGVVGKPDEVATAGKKRSPKRGGGAQKLRIHQMDFKQQGKVDRRRRRPLKQQLPEKPEETGSLVKPVTTSQTRVTPPVSVDQQPTATVPQEDTYALNILADCSSKEGEKMSPVPTSSTEQVELAYKRALMRSPGSIAGANSLLLLAKPDQISSDTARDSYPPENAVIDGLLKLSNSSIPGSIPQDQSHTGIRNQNVATSEPGSQTAEEGTSARGTSGGSTKKKRVPAPLSVGGSQSEGDDVDSEKTDTDSEATLSPTTPAPTSAGGSESLSHSTSGATSDGVVTSSKTPGTVSAAVETETADDGSRSEKRENGLGGSTEVDGANLAVGVESERMMREALQATSSTANGASLQVVEDEEGGDVDVENVDSASQPEKPVKQVSEKPAEPVSEKPAELVSNSPQQPASKSAPVSPTERRVCSLAPEIVPSSPQESAVSPSATHPDSPSGTPERVGVVGGVVSTDESPSLGDGGNVGVAKEADECPSPPKKPRLEEEERDKGDEMEVGSTAEQQVNMDTASPPHQTHITPGTSSPAPPDDVTSPARHSQTPPPDPVSLDPTTDRTSDGEKQGGESMLSGDDFQSCDSADASSEVSLSLPDYIGQTSDSQLTTTTATAAASNTTATETSGDGDSEASITAAENPLPDATTGCELGGEVGGVSSGTTGFISWPSEEEEGETGVEPTPPSSPLHPETTSEHTTTKFTSSSPHHGNATATTTTNFIPKRAISPIQPPGSADQPLVPPNPAPLDDIRPQPKDTPGNKNRVANDQAPPTVAQNRLPVGKSSFDRHQQSRKFTSQHTHKQHSRGEEKSLQVKKWSRPTDPGSMGRGLFDVDPQEGAWRGKGESRPSDREQVKHVSIDGRKVKPRVPHSNKPAAAERSKYTRPRVEDTPTRHARPAEPHPGGVWETGKQKSHSSGAPRQGFRYSPEVCPPDQQRDREDTPTEDEGTRRGKAGHTNSHGAWRDDRQSPTTDHTPRERSHAPLKHKPHPSKPGFEHVRKTVRPEKDQRKYNTDDEERVPTVFKRHRDDDSDHAPSSVRLKHGSRKRSYESISEEEGVEDLSGVRCSSRESSLVAEDRTATRRPSQEVGGDSSRWRKEEKRGAELDDYTRGTKHKKHKHDSKERKERRKWRKQLAEGGGSGAEMKLKRSMEEKPWLGYHKH